MANDGQGVSGSRASTDGGAELLCVGAVAGAHGVRGTVRIKAFTEEPEAVTAYGRVTDETGSRDLGLTLIGRWKGGVLGKLNGIASREAAEALKGLRLYVDRSNLPGTDEGEFYHADLVGLPVFLAADPVDAAPTGSPVGEVQALHDFGAGDLLEIITPDGRQVLLPFTEAAVPEIDVTERRIVINPPPGLFDDT